ncbi:MarR family transcriptional regulator [Flavobacterium sp. HTF]|uniref:MarR family transcriptional regulator n=1 Tax=Flavobacterium sp. HTF TaxID=2170732 RepID=UPI000D5E3DC5|nr:MarR family transcriptional regulator [Flavobacterium sp. HTF]PWB26411.1 MarR family transcriptional regulator [Flavobacterium sp. HTF]
MKIEEIIRSTIALPVSRKILLNIIYTQNSICERFNEILKPYDLSSEQLNVLEILNDQNGIPANMCVIQEKMITKTSNTTRLVDKLLLKKLVKREVCTENRRKIDVFITPKGIEFVNEIKPKISALEEKMAHNLSPDELDNLNLLLEKYRTKINIKS